MKQENHSTGIMHGKRGIVMGVANDRSIAWGIANAIANIWIKSLKELGKLYMSSKKDIKNNTKVI